MNLGLENKVAIVTGAGRGIGKSIASSFVEEKVNLILNDIDEEILLATIDEIKGKNKVKIDYVIGDMSEEDVIDQLIDTAKINYEKLDILVNNAGISPKLPFEEITLSEYDRVMNVNLRSVWICCQKAVELMKQQKSGRIINMSSMAGLYGGIKSAAHYSVSKAGILGLTMTIARQLGPYNITTNSLAPGRISTAMTDMLDQTVIDKIISEIPLGRLGTTQEVANCVVFLASEAASYINGQCIEVSGFYLP